MVIFLAVEEIIVAYKRVKNLKELLARADPYSAINNDDHEMYAYIPHNKRCNLCTKPAVAK